MTQPIYHHKFRPWRVVGEQRVVAAESAWKKPIKWNANAGAAHKGRKASVSGRDDGEVQAYESVAARPRVFCASLADVFEDWPGVMRGPKGGFLHHAEKWQVRDGRSYVELSDIAIGRSRVTLDDVRARLFRLIDATPHLDWLLLTKRPENVRRMLPVDDTKLECSECSWKGDESQSQSREFCDEENGWECPQCEAACAHQPIDEASKRNNVWLGVSIACQNDADRLIPQLLKCRDLCAKTFLSIEPMLDDIDIRKWLTWELDIDESRPPGHFTRRTTGIDWVIVGGESGRNARSCNVAWIRSLVRQCRVAGVPPFVKQVGSRVIDRNDAGFTAEWDDGIGWSESVEVEEHIGGYLTDYQGAPVRVRTRDKKGGDPAEWPEDIRVREVPK